MSDDIRENQFLADIRSAAQGQPTYYDLEPVINKEKYYADIITALKNGGGGGGGFTPTTEQLAAMNSGITSEGVQQISANETNILSNKTDIVKLDYGYNDIGMLGEFAIGGLNTDGSLLPSQNMRISSTNTITTPPYDIDLIVAPNYRVGYIPFINGSAGAWVGWDLSKMTIPANTTLKFQIARSLNTDTVEGNIKEYTHAIRMMPSEYPTISDISNFKWGEGSVSSAGVVQSDGSHKNLYTSAIDVSHCNKIIISIDNNVYKYGYHTYDAQFRSIDNSAVYETEQLILDVSAATFIRINVARNDGQTISLAEKDNIKLKIISISQFTDKSKNYSYSGNVNIGNTYAVKNYATYTPTASLPSTTQQGMSIYNGKAFLLYDKGGLAIYDILNKQSIAEFTLASASADNHCNSCNFSTEIISGGVYPLLYISECYGQHRCFVENITNAGSTLIQTITFSNENGDYTNSTYNNAFDWILDNDTGMLMTYGLMSDGKHKIKMFAKPDTSNATVTMGETDVIDEWIVEDYIYPTLSSNYIYQGNCAKGGVIYLLAHQSNEIICISEDTHVMTARVPLTYNTTGEPEDLAIYADTMFVVYGDKKIYGMSFD